MALQNLRGENPPIFADLRTKYRHFEPRHSAMRGKSRNLKQQGQSVTRWGRSYQTWSRGGSSIHLWDRLFHCGMRWASKIWIDITSAVWQLATRCLILGVGFRVKLSNEDIAEIEGLRDVAMATTFWLLMSYNFGCVIASDTLCDSMGGFSGLRYPMMT